MKRVILVTVGGAILGAGAAAAVVLAGFDGLVGREGGAVVAATPVRVSGRLGPHLVLAERVFNLQTAPRGMPAYLKFQTTIEFETTSEAWARVLHGCAFDAGHPVGGDRFVSTVPLRGDTSGRISPEEGPAGGPCAAEERALLAEFAQEIGTGRQLLEDALTAIVSGHQLAEIASPQGKEALKEEILRVTQALLPEHPPIRVLFTTFITQ